MDSVQPEVFAGIDVAKDWLDLHVEPNEHSERFDNTNEGIQLLIERLTSLGATFVAFEHTGRYGRKLMGALEASQINSAMIDGRQIRGFATAIRRIAKTDPLDAKTIAEFASLIRPTKQTYPLEQELKPNDLVVRRRQVVDFSKMEKARLTQDTNEEAINSINQHLAWLKAEEQRLSELIFEMIGSRSDWKRRYEIIKSYPGAGPVLASTLTAELPELGRIGKSKISSLVGVAPIPRESGQITDRRRIVGGRKSVRNALYMASISAQRTNPTIAKVIEKMVSAGKPKKVARVAAMRKMLITIDAMVRDDRPWDPDVGG